MFVLYTAPRSQNDAFVGEQVKRDALKTGVEFDPDGLDAAWENKIAPIVREYGPSVVADSDFVLSQGVGHIIEAMHGRFEEFTHATHPDYHTAAERD